MPVVSKLFKKCQSLHHQSKIVDGRWNALKFAYLRVARIRFPRVVMLKVKSLRHPLAVRPGTTDLSTLVGAFHAGYHRPPAEMSDNPVILDLGSNVGYTIADMAAKFSSARIIGVEMDRDNYAMAVQNTRAFGERCTVLHGAVWKSDGQVAYSGSNADAFHIDNSTSGGRNTVPALSIASIRKKFDLPRIDYLKMDIEGAETDIILDSTEWTNGVASMKVEIHHKGDLERLLPLLEKAGFTCRPCPLHWSSIIAIRS